MSEQIYDYLIVGADLFGSVFARQMADDGKRCLVIDRWNHIAGNIYSQEIEDIPIGGYTKMVENMLAGIEVKA